MEESELLRLLQRGDPAGLEALIVRYTPYVSAVAARILPGCPREWEEVAADVFWAAWQERKKLQPGRLKGWLSVTARNRALNLLRSRRETVPLAEDILVLSGDGPQQELEAREDQAASGEVPGFYMVQTGVFRLRSNAEAQLQELKDQGFPAFMTVKDGLFYVRAGAFREMDNAVQMERRLRRLGYGTLITRS